LAGEPQDHLLSGVADSAADGQAATGASALAIQIGQGAGLEKMCFLKDFGSGGEKGKLLPEADVVFAQSNDGERDFGHRATLLSFWVDDEPALRYSGNRHESDRAY
jgi:hypothetical protein